MSEPAKPQEKPAELPKPKLKEKEIIKKAAEAAHKTPPKKPGTSQPPVKKKQTPKPASKPATPAPSSQPEATKPPAKGYVRKPFLMRRGR